MALSLPRGWEEETEATAGAGADGKSDPATAGLFAVSNRRAAGCLGSLGRTNETARGVVCRGGALPHLLRLVGEGGGGSDGGGGTIVEEKVEVKKGKVEEKEKEKEKEKETGGKGKDGKGKGKGKVRSTQ